MITKRRNLVFRFLPGLFLSGLLLLSGCSQDDVSNVPAGSRAIGFRAQGGMSSLKATTAGATDIHSFVVNAHYGAGAWDSSADKFLLQGTTVYRGEDNVWTYSPKAYYPTEDEGNVEFFAYSPANSKHMTTSKLGLATTATQTISYKVEAPSALQGSATVQEDLLVAYDKKAASSYTLPDFDGTVILTFRHALSRVLVAAGSKIEEPVTIKSLKLKNLYSEGTLSLKGNTATGAGNKSNGIPAYSAASPHGSWVYTAGDYVTLWDYTDTQTKEYPYLLPESGVSVGEYVESPQTLPLVTGRDQGMFILPQTTADLDTSNEFGLEVEYSVGSGSPKTSTIRFGDLDNQVGKGVTFEIGREYVLNLVFSSGASGTPGGTDGGGITIGASVSFSAIADSYNGPVYVDAGTPDGLPIWAQSNIYFEEEDDTDPECVVGHLAFADENDDSKKLYQGVFFKWGSLIGVDPVTAGSFGSDTYMFIPDFVSDKYIKVKVSNVSTKASAYYGVVGATTYASIPCVDDELGPYDRANDDLRDYSPSGYQGYRGDICRFLSGSTGVSGSWRLPKSAEFGNNGSIEYDKTGMTGATIVTTTDVNGTDAISYHVTSEAISHNGKEVTFPASGLRYGGNLSGVGSYGYCWASSAYNGSNAYALDFTSGHVYPYNNNDVRSSGYSLRCIRE